VAGTRAIGDWRQARLLPRPSIGAGSTAIPRSRLDGSVDGALRSFLEWETGLRLVVSPSDNTPDPYGTADLPGREPPASLVEGFPSTPWGNPDPTPEPVAPLWLERTGLRAADPLVLPANPTGGPLLLFDLLAPDSSRAASAARLTSGTNRTYTEEFALARPGRSSVVRVAYGDSKTEGRLGAGYFSQFEENLLARYDRASAWGGWRLGWQQGTTRVPRRFGDRYLHDRSMWEAGARVRAGAWSGDLSLGLGWSRLEREGDPWVRRKETAGRALLRLEGPHGFVRPLFTAQLDRVHRRFRRTGTAPFAENSTSVGPGVAGGVERTTGAWQWRGSFGWTRPTPERSGWIAAVDGQGPLPWAWQWRAHADRTVRAPLVPRLAGDLLTPVGQGVWIAASEGAAAGVIVRPDSPLEEIRRFELELRRTGARAARPAPPVEISTPDGSVAGAEGGTATGPEGAVDPSSEGREGGADGGAPPVEVEPGRLLSLRLRFVQFRHAIVPTEEQLAWFIPAYFGLLPASALDREIRVVAVHGSARWPLPFGLRIEARAAARASDPGWKSQLWMTPFDAQARLSWARSFFRDDLWIELFLRGEFAGRRASPSGIFAASDRYDGGALARSGPLTFFFTLRNLESDEAVAADQPVLAEDGWMTRPLRTYRIGLTWRFLD